MLTGAARSTPLTSAANAALMFPTLSSPQIARIASHGLIRPVTRGEVLIEGGHTDVPFFVVKAGEIEVIRPSGLGDLFPPRLVVECGEPAGRRLRAAEHIDDDVDAAQVLERALCDKGAPLSRRDVRRDVVHAGKRVAPNRASRGHHVRAVLSQHFDDGGADSLRPGRDERSATRESKIEAILIRPRPRRRQVP